jgi:hypothetical protein
MNLQTLSSFLSSTAALVVVASLVAVAALGALATLVSLAAWASVSVYCRVVDARASAYAQAPKKSFE